MPDNANLFYTLHTKEDVEKGIDRAMCTICSAIFKPWENFSIFSRFSFLFLNNKQRTQIRMKKNLLSHLLFLIRSCIENPIQSLVIDLKLKLKEKRKNKNWKSKKKYLPSSLHAFNKVLFDMSRFIQRITSLNQKYAHVRASLWPMAVNMNTSSSRSLALPISLASHM